MSVATQSAFLTLDDVALEQALDYQEGTPVSPRLVRHLSGMSDHELLVALGLATKP